MRRTLTIFAICGATALFLLAFATLSGSGGRISRVKTGSIELVNAAGIAVGPDGRLYLADTQANRILRLAPDGTASVIAGTGRWAFSPDGTPAIAASLVRLVAIAVDSRGEVYFIEQPDAGLVRHITSDGRLETLAGTRGTPGAYFDGMPATQARLEFPSGLARDAAGNLYVAAGGVAFRVGPDGLMSLFAGGKNDWLNNPFHEGDPAIGANLIPEGIGLDPAGNLYIADRGSESVRKVDRHGRMFTVSPSHAPFGSISPRQLAVDRQGNVYVSQGYAQSVLQISPSGHVMPITAGGFLPAVRIGSSASATRVDAESLALDRAGNLYIAAGPAVYRIAAPLPAPLFGDVDPLVAGGVALILCLLLSTGLHAAGVPRAGRYSNTPPAAAGGQLP